MRNKRLLRNEYVGFKYTPQIHHCCQLRDGHPCLNLQFAEALVQGLNSTTLPTLEGETQKKT